MAAGETLDGTIMVHGGFTAPLASKLSILPILTL